MTQPPENAELAACPFCGCDASQEFFSIHSGWSIFCDGCHASSETKDELAEAITAWNTRASLSPPVLPGVREALEPFAKAAEDYRWPVWERDEAPINAVGNVTVGDLRRAKQALALLPSETPNAG